MLSLDVILLLLVLTGGSVILNVYSNVSRAVVERDRVNRLARMTEQQKKKIEDRRLRFQKIGKPKLILIGVGITGVFTVLVLLILFLVTTLLPTSPQVHVPTIHYPALPPTPQHIGLFMGVAILVILIRVIVGIRFDEDEIETEPPTKTIREALKTSFQVDSLVDVVSFPLVIYASLLIGNWQIPMNMALGVDPVEIGAIGKTIFVVLTTVFILDGTAVLRQRLAKRMRSGDEQIKAANQFG